MKFITLGPEPHPDPRKTPPAYIQAGEHGHFLLGTMWKSERHAESQMNRAVPQSAALQPSIKTTPDFYGIHGNFLPPLPGPGKKPQHFVTISNGAWGR